MCRFELWRHYDGGPTLTPSAHPWCAAFTEEDMRLLEDNEDLLYYYRDGYPFNVTAEMTGVLLRDLLTSLQQQHRDSGDHGEPLQPVVLGLVLALAEVLDLVRRKALEHQNPAAPDTALMINSTGDRKVQHLV